MARQKILVVDDDHKTVDLIRLYLEREGYGVITAAAGQEALDRVRQRTPDLVVLDLMLPQVNGLDICRVLRFESDLPIIMLTARSTEEDILLGLELGADDYLTKPFSPRELVARVRTVLRRAGDDPARARQAVRFGELEVNFLRHEASLRGTPLHLTPREFKLLETFAREPTRAFTRLELLEHAFGFDYKGMERTVDAHIMNLRRKIEPDPERSIYIQTVFGVGYRFGMQADEDPDAP